MSDDSKIIEAEKTALTSDSAASGEKKSKTQPAKAKGKEKKTSSGLSLWFKEIRAEAGKIIWPNRKELSKMTLTVIVTSLLFGVLIAGMDVVLTFATGFLSGLL